MKPDFEIAHTGSDQKEVAILAENTRQELVFYDSLDPDDLKSSFQSEKAFANQTARDCVRMAKVTGDDAFFNEVSSKLNSFLSSKVPN